MDRENIVKEIFEKQKQAVDKVSTIFTHFRPASKAVLFPKPKTASLPAGLPAAVDVGTSSIKIVQLAQGSGSELEIIAIDREQYSSDRHEFLKRIISRNKIGPEVIASISAKEVQVYNFSFPQMSEEELKQAIRWKVAQTKPFGLSLEAVVYSYIKGQKLPGLKTPQQRVLVACAAKETVQRTISLFSELSLKPIAIEVAPISLINLAAGKKSFTSDNSVTLWLDLGAEESTLVIAKTGSLCFWRPLTFTSQHLTNQIAKALGVSEPEAEKLKKEQGFSFWSPDKKSSVFLKENKDSKQKEDLSQIVYRSLVSALENLVVDIEHSFKYFSYQVTQSQITKFDKVILAGGGANLKNLDRFLNSRLEVPVERASPLLSFKVPATLREQKRQFFTAPAEFSVASGMALASQVDQEERINLLPQEEKKGLELLTSHLKERPVKIAALAVGLAIFLILIQVFRVGFYGWKTNSFNKKVRSAQSSLSALQSKQLKLAEKEGQLLERKIVLESRLAILDSAVRRPEEFSKVLAQVATLLPEEIWVTKLLYLEEKISLTGSTSDLNLVTQLIETLKQSDDFTEVVFNYTQKEPKSNVYNFEITAQVKP